MDEVKQFPKSVTRCEGKTAPEFKMVALTENQKKAQYSRALGIVLSLAVVALVLYAASFARLSGV